MEIRRARKADLDGIMKMARKLWPGVKELDLNRPKFTYYVADDGKALIGFIMLAVRKDYVEGSSTSPVGYIEGIYVENGSRKKNIGRQLVNAAEEWCAKKGLIELGSDVEFENKTSQRFHERIGFGGRSLIAHYIKKVRPEKSGRTL